MLKRAELVLADLTPGALLNRLDRGVVYAPEKAQRAKENFFKEPTLAALREMALRQAAHEVESSQRIDVSDGAYPSDANASNVIHADRERILIHITSSPSTAALIRRGRRVADYLRADCFAIAVVSGGTTDRLPSHEREAIDRHLEFARKMRIETRVVPRTSEEDDEAGALVDFARHNRVTQIFLSKPGSAGFRRWRFGGDLVSRILRLAGDLQVNVVASRGS